MKKEVSDNIEKYVEAQKRMEAGRVAFNGEPSRLEAPEGMRSENPNAPKFSRLNRAVSRIGNIRITDLLP